METSPEKQRTTKPRRRQSSKAQARPSADRVKVSIVLTSDVDFKLSVAAAALRMDRSALVNKLLGESATLRRFVVQDRAKPPDGHRGDTAEGQGGELPDSPAS